MSRKEEFYKILHSIENLYGVFYALGRMGSPKFLDESVDFGPNMPKTACVKFDKIGQCIEFCFYEKFWDSLTDDDRRFVLAHEMLHILLESGVRLSNCEIPVVGNIAADIVINEMLISDYGLKSPANRKEYCFIDTVFPDPNIIDKERALEYYYDLIDKNKSNIKITAFDGHEFLKDFNNPQVAQKIVDSLADTLSKEELAKLSKELNDAAKDGKPLKKDGADKQAGNIAAGIEFHVTRQKIVKKRKWETVISRWVKNSIKYNRAESWLNENVRYRALPKDMALPGNRYEEIKTKKRITLYMFADTSGSCVHLVQRFYNAVSSIPEDRFDIRVYNFDTTVYSISKKDMAKGTWKGGGGTSFTCIEDYIQSEINKNNEAYPSQVFVITDGYANLVNPQHPERWQFFLSENYTSCIPKSSKIHMLKDFE